MTRPKGRGFRVRINTWWSLDPQKYDKLQECALVEEELLGHLRMAPQHPVPVIVVGPCKSKRGGYFFFYGYPANISADNAAGILRSLPGPPPQKELAPQQQVGSSEPTKPNPELPSIS